MQKMALGLAPGRRNWIAFLWSLARSLLARESLASES
jgi:hypothetical protein